jgi:hypothetical protein
LWQEVNEFHRQKLKLSKAIHHYAAQKIQSSSSILETWNNIYSRFNE